jgi:bacterioferritin (cytochrome b1)
MVTLTGTQSDLTKAVKDLIELEYDAHEAYLSAIKRLESEHYRDRLTKFMRDHEDHIKQLSSFLRKCEETPPEGPSTKQWLTKGKTVLASLVGDNAILMAMLSNEEDTNTAYDRMTKREDLEDDLKEILNKAYSDEKEHKSWLSKNVN